MSDLVIEEFLGLLYSKVGGSGWKQVEDGTYSFVLLAGMYPCNLSNTGGFSFTDIVGLYFLVSQLWIVLEVLVSQCSRSFMSLLYLVRVCWLL